MGRLACLPKPIKCCQKAKPIRIRMNAEKPETSAQHAMETTSKRSDDEHEMEVYVHFIPSSEIKVFKVRPTTTIRDLKILSEEKCGIPSDVLIFMHNAVVLDDSLTIADLGSSEYAMLDLFVHLIWERFIKSCFKGENERVMARVHIKMNQLSPEARAFVAAFIAAQKGNSELFQMLIESFKKEVMYRTVCLSGRSLLHAAVLGGNISCVMTLVINGGWELLNQADKQREVPLDMAQRMKKEGGLVQILTKYNDIYICKHWENDPICEWERLLSDETIKRAGKEAQLSGDEGGQDDRLPSGNKEDSSTVEEKEVLPRPPTQVGREQCAAGRGHRFLQRLVTPRPKLHIPAPTQQDKCTKSQTASSQSPNRNQVILQKNVETVAVCSNIKRAEAVHLPFVNMEGNSSPLVSPKYPQREFLLDTMSRRSSLPRDIKRSRSPSSPTLTRTKHPQKQMIERPRTSSLIGQRGR